MEFNELNEAELAAQLKHTCAAPATPKQDVQDAVWQKVSKRLSGQGEVLIMPLAAPRSTWRWWLAGSTVAASLLIALLLALRGDPTWDMAQAPATEQYKALQDGSLRCSPLSPPEATARRLRECIAMPPDVHSKTELGDHYETVTNSAFGNPAAHAFHGKSISEGGGGMGGASSEDLIGIGASSNPGGDGNFGVRNGPERLLTPPALPQSVPAVATPLLTPAQPTKPVSDVRHEDPAHLKGTYSDLTPAGPKDSPPSKVFRPDSESSDTRGNTDIDALKEKARELLRKIDEAEQRAPQPANPPGPYANLQEIKPNVQVLAGGVQDDNADFDKFLGFLQQTSAPGAIKQDISERVLIEVSDVQGLPLTNADVRIISNGRTLHKARTYSNGLALFFPRVAGADTQSQEFRVEVVPPPGCSGQTLMQDFRGRSGTWRLQVPYARPQSAAKLDILLCLDCTGSMNDELARIQKTLQMMVAKFNALPGKPQTRWGLVQYRDRGDQYVTQVHDFTEDTQKFQKKLDECKADAGGDEAESVNEALDKAVEGVSWDRSDAIRLVFLVGDAPPHMDYANDVKYTESAAKAQRRAIKLYPLAASGLNKTGELIFRQLAQYTLARFLFISYGGGTAHEVSKPGQSNNLDDLIVHIVASEVNARVTPLRAPQQIEDPERWQK